MTAKKSFFAFLLFCLVCCRLALPVFASEDTPVHWRVAWTGDPRTTATVSWDTQADGGSHRITIQAEGSAELNKVSCQRNGAYDKGRSENWFYHHARLTNLLPGTKYTVALHSNDEQSARMYFVTAPAEEKPLALLFGGDSRSGLEERKAVNRMIARLVAEQARTGRPDVMALAHGGDYIRDGRKLDQWMVWLADHELTRGADGRLLPIVPARGNHDPGPIFNELFDFPPGDTNYYGISLGPEVRLITLNTETSTAGDQQTWLAEELSQSRPTHRWLLAQYHKPAFPAVKVPSGAYASWVPLFEKHNLDLACEADGHCIKRTPPIRGSGFDPTGVVYIGEGGLGVGQRTPKAGRWFLDSPQAKVGRGHHVHLLTFTPDSLTIRVILLEDGKVFDEHTIPARSTGTQSGG